MKFELFVVGEIKSGNAGRGRSENIFEIRKQLEPQLRRVWESQPLLEFDKQKGIRGSISGLMTNMVCRWVSNTRFIPVICEGLHLAARIEFTFYEPTGSLSVASEVSDIDNRLKTLFDALRYPRDVNEIGDRDYGNEFHCLLDDDIRIWEITVKRTRLLRDMEGQDRFARISVEAIASQTTLNNLSLLGVPVH